MLDVLTIGSATLDIFLKSDQFKIDRHHKDGVLLCERYEEKMEAQELVMVSGGGATNAAVSYARKGFEVAPIIELGKDPVAELILTELGKENVSLSYVIQEPDEKTAISVILFSGNPSPPKLPSGGGSIVTYRGASRMLTVSDVPFEKLGMSLKPGGWVHLTSVGGDMELVLKIFSWCKEKNRKLFWNPGKAEVEKGSALHVQGRAFQYSPDVLQLNRLEASTFFQINFMDEKTWRSEHCPTPPQTMLVITDGAQGGRVCYQGTCSWYEGIKTTMVDSTGAGDAFGSGFVAGLLSGKSLPDALEWGKRQAASVVEKIGAKEGLLTKEEIE